MRVPALVLTCALALAVASPAMAQQGDPTWARTAPEPAPGHILMMDTATTPTLSEIKTWQASSPYRAIGVYIPITPEFDVRYDKVQTNLTADWVREVRAGGWEVLPIYVGLQASCSQFSKRLSPNTDEAWAQGAAMAADAADSVFRLGLPVGAPIAYDMEGYPTGKPACTASFQAMVDGWTRRLHELGRNSAVYGSVNSTITDLTNASKSPTYAQPDAIWVARWDGNPDTTFEIPPDDMWVGRRMHQFTGGGRETYGGVTINIDESAVQPTALQLPPPDTTPPSLVASTVQITRHGRAKISWRMRDGSGIARYQVQIKSGRHWSKPSNLRRTKTTHRTVAVDAGGRVCARARGTDRAGNTSGWQTTCLYRWGTAKPFRITRHKAVGPRVSGRTVALTLRGPRKFTVWIGSHLLGTVGGGTHRLTSETILTGRLILRPVHVTKRPQLRLVRYLVTP